MVTDDDPGQEGGDAACWIDRTCPGCGYLQDGEPPAVCPRCGLGTPAATRADDSPAGGDTDPDTSGVVRRRGPGPP